MAVVNIFYPNEMPERSDLESALLDAKEALRIRTQSGLIPLPSNAALGHGGSRSGSSRDRRYRDILQDVANDPDGVFNNQILNNVGLDIVDPNTIKDLNDKETALLGEHFALFSAEQERLRQAVLASRSQEQDYIIALGTQSQAADDATKQYELTKIKLALQDEEGKLNSILSLGNLSRAAYDSETGRVLGLSSLDLQGRQLSANTFLTRRDQDQQYNLALAAQNSKSHILNYLLPSGSRLDSPEYVCSHKLSRRLPRRSTTS